MDTRDYWIGGKYSGEEWTLPSTGEPMTYTNFYGNINDACEGTCLTLVRNDLSVSPWVLDTFYWVNSCGFVDCALDFDNGYICETPGTVYHPFIGFLRAQTRLKIYLFPLFPFVEILWLICVLLLFSLALPSWIQVSFNRL